MEQLVVKEGEIVQEERGYDKSQGDKSNVGNRKEEEVREQRGENIAEEGGEEYMFKGEDGRPSINWRR